MLDGGGNNAQVFKKSFLSYVRDGDSDSLETLIAELKQQNIPLYEVVTATNTGSVPVVNPGVPPKNPEKMSALIDKIYEDLSAIEDEEQRIAALNKSQILILAAYYGNIELVKKICQLTDIDINIKCDRGVTAACIAVGCASPDDIQNRLAIAEEITQSGGRFHAEINNKDGAPIKQGQSLSGLMTTFPLTTILEFENKFNLDDCEYYAAFSKGGFSYPNVLPEAGNIEHRPKYLELIKKSAERSKEYFLVNLLEVEDGKRQEKYDVFKLIMSKFEMLAEIDPDLLAAVTQQASPILQQIEDDYNALKGINHKIIAMLGPDGLKKIGIDNLILIGADALNVMGADVLNVGGADVLNVGGADGVKKLAENLQQMVDLARQNRRYAKDLASIMNDKESPEELKALYNSIKPQIDAGQNSLLAQINVFINESIKPFLHKMLPNYFGDPYKEQQEKYNVNMDNVLTILENAKSLAEKKVEKEPTVAERQLNDKWQKVAANKSLDNEREV